MGKERSHINLQYDRQQQQADSQNAWQSSENAIDRQWQEELWKQQFAQQVEQQNEMFEKEGLRWLEQFNAQNEYNLPSNQVARLRAAGVNPAAMVSQLAGSGVSSASPSGSSGASAPSPSGGSSHGVTPIGFNGINGLSSDAAMFSSLAQMGDSLATLAKAGSDVSVQQREVGARITNMISDANLKDSQTALANVQKILQETYGKDKASAEIGKLLSGAFADYAAGKQSESSVKYNEAMVLLTKQETWQKSEMFPTLLANAKSLGEKIKAETAGAYAGAKASLASAKASLASVDASEASARLANAQSEYQEFTNNMRNNFKEEEFDAYVSGLVAKGYLNDNEAAEARRMIEVRGKVRNNEFSKALDNALEYLKQKLPFSGSYNVTNK